MFCTHCGHNNPDDARFCANCGRPLTAGTEDANATGALRLDDVRADDTEGALSEAEHLAAELSPGTALLVTVRGGEEGQRFLLDKDAVSVGRHPESDIFLDDITVSRRHAEFHRAHGGFWLHDAGSLNGTYVNGQRTERQELASGDEVQIGKFKLIVYVAPDSTQPE